MPTPAHTGRWSERHRLPIVRRRDEGDKKRSPCLSRDQKASNVFCCVEGVDDRNKGKRDRVRNMPGGMAGSNSTEPVSPSQRGNLARPAHSGQSARTAATADNVDPKVRRSQGYDQYLRFNQITSYHERGVHISSRRSQGS